ncbi:alpha/beta fold hydrolase [Actinokineospora sp. NBRC 105648]|uniref:alpha/beta fold hydrolase n=1 Tax=Actinokineospora sp. NBRC 105648 TaxID=3032206 RepID=UPI0024A48C6E|nr:alpha/beta fold hydrolase [Actinokineospora sp. NBRC 105648]GLZ43764.1 alpha/beta hydrolase [Actinokineospora sp. NBRC 105648]
MPLLHQLQAIPMTPGTTASRIEIHSGLARHYPRIHANLVRRTDATTDVGLVLMHPTSNFLTHFLLEPLAEAGLPVLGLNTRYVGNDATTVMENVLLDIGAAVRWMREELGYRKVILVGFSGGGPAVAYYQSQAEKPFVTATPAGDPPDLTTAGLPPADGLALVAAHAGRGRLLATWIDPSVRDETNPDDRDPELDLFLPGRTPPFDADWVQAYRTAQVARMDRISTWAEAELARLSALGIGDRAFVVHRTVADPRFVDLSLDLSDRVVGSMYGDPKVANEAGAGLARFQTLRGWLSSWSLRHSYADAVERLPETTVPVLVLGLMADQGAMPDNAKLMFEAVGAPRGTLVEMPGLNHYMVDQENGRAEVVARIGDWLTAENLR